MLGAKKVIKGQGVQPDDIVYPFADTHKFYEEVLRGDCIGVEELIIGGDRYKVQPDEKGNYSLIRFNEKYKMWVELQFAGLLEDIQSIITEALRMQYIDRILSRSS